MTDDNLSLDGIRAILFDLDGTLRHSRPAYSRALFDFAARMGVTGSDEQRRRALRWMYYYFADSPEIGQDFQALKDDHDLFMTNYLRRYLIAYDCPPEKAADLAPEIFHRMSEELQSMDWVDPDTPETLRVLKQSGFTLGVVSNRREPFHDALEELGLGSYFDFTLAAGEVNSWKPDVLIFQHAVQRAGSRPACTLYVGDNYFADIVGAQRAGLKPVLLDPERIFPEAECPVICSLGELRAGLHLPESF